MLPMVLGLGLLGANEWARQRRVSQQEEAMTGAYQRLLGQAPEAMGPPDIAGGMGRTGGSGLLANPRDPSAQLQFAAGIMGLPGQQQLGANMLNQIWQRAQQGEQWQQGQAQQAEQFSRGEQRQAEQFGMSHQLARDQFGNTQSQQAQALQQWLAQFGLAQQEAARRAQEGAAQLDISRGNLGVARERLGIDRAEAERKAVPDMPKLSPGWMYGPSGAGVVAMPIPGTEDYAKATGANSALQGAEQRIGRLNDMLLGAEKTVNGRKIRTGGVGTELWGENAATYSTLRGQIIADVAKLRDMGVLQAGELERIEQQLPDPSGLMAPLRRNKSIARGYAELQEQFKLKRQQHLSANPWLIPPPPPGFTPQGQ
jgi:hypothetical protein